MKMQNPQWEIKTYNSQIADTGDYEGYYELTNGDISLITRDDIEEVDQEGILVWLNDINVKWENWDKSNLEFELHLEKENCKKWKEVAGKLYKELSEMRIRSIFNKSESSKGALKLYEDTLNNLP